MSEFTDFEVSVEDNKNEEKDEEGSDNDLDSLSSFIDGNDEIEDDRIFYQKSENDTASVDDISKEEYNKSIAETEKIELSNFCETSEEEPEIDNFKNVKKRVEKFKETLFSVSLENDGVDYNSFVNAIFLALRYDIEQKSNICSLSELKESIDKNLFIKLNKEKFNIVLDHQKFNNQCHEVNTLLAKHGYFLRFFELRSKFRHLTLKNSKTQNMVRQFASCSSEKYNGFHVVSVEYSKRLRKKFKSMTIIYKPVKSREKKFSVIIHKTYQNHIRIHVKVTVKKYHTDLLLNVITA